MDKRMNIQMYPENLVSRVTFVLLSSIFGQKFSTIPRFFLARRRIPVKELNPISPITQYLREVSQYARPRPRNRATREERPINR